MNLLKGTGTTLDDENKILIEGFKVSYDLIANYFTFSDLDGRNTYRNEVYNVEPEKNIIIALFKNGTTGSKWKIRLGGELIKEQQK